MADNLYSDDDTILIVTKRIGYIPHIHRYGPFYNPIERLVSACMAMIKDGAEVYQIDPEGGMVLRLTEENLYDADKFNPTTLEPEEPEADPEPDPEPEEPEPDPEPEPEEPDPEP